VTATPVLGDCAAYRIQEPEFGVDGLLVTHETKRYGLFAAGATHLPSRGYGAAAGRPQQTFLLDEHDRLTEYVER
jgi:hypothetical protein